CMPFVATWVSGVAEDRLELLKMGGDPARVDGPPVADDIVPGIVALALLLDEYAVDVQFGQGFQGVLGGASGHAGGCHQRWHVASRAAVDQPGHVQAAVETGFGFADFHGVSVSGDRAGEEWRGGWTKIAFLSTEAA